MIGVRLLAALVLLYTLQYQGRAGAAAAPNSFTISGYVWDDANGDGSLSIWEKKSPGMTVRVRSASTGAVVRAARTSAAGNYVIRDVPGGTYRIEAVAPAGYSAPPSGAFTVNSNLARNLRIAKPRSVEERALNAFGDPWRTARQNDSLPLAGTTGCYRKPAPGMTPRFMQEELQYFRRLSATFYFEGCAVLLETNPPYSDINDAEERTIFLKQRVAQFKAANPSFKYFGYFLVTSFEEGQVGSATIFDLHKEWFVYKKGSTSMDADNIVLLSKNAWLIDITNPQFQNFLSSRLAQALSYYRIDGLILDAVAPLPRLMNPSTLPDAKRAAWQAGWIAFLTKLKAKVGPNRYVFASVPRGDNAHARKIIPLVDGIMLEDTFSPVRNDIAVRIGQLQPTIDAAAAAGKWVVTTQNTKVDRSAFATTTPAREHALERYYLAAYYIFNKGKMLFYYNPPSATTPQYGAEAFFSDWNIDVGTPVGAYTRIASHPGVYQRRYTNAIIYLNSSRSSYRIPIPAGSQFKLDPNGRTITSYQLQPKTGFILSRPEAFR